MYRFNCLEGGIVDIIERLRKGKGFIAALDQSGGSSKKTLVNYGFLEKDIINDDVMFDFIHQMRSRLISNKYFDSKHILGVILFNKTMKGQINGINTVKYLSDKGVVSFLKIDLGLDEESDGVQLLKSIDNLDDYDVIFVGYPIWWYDMPSIMYTFFEQYDFAGKTIIPFTTHGGSQLSGTVETIAELEPDATVSDQEYTVSRNDVTDAASEVAEWISSLNLSE